VVSKKQKIMSKKTIYWIVGVAVIIWIIFCNMNSGMSGGPTTKVGCEGRRGSIKFKGIKLFCSPFVKCI
jgi:hypothetical protein